RRRGRRRSGVHIWAAIVVRWVLTLSPGDFRFARSRWSCEAAAVVLREDYGVRVGRETVRLWLRAGGLVWRRPRPVIRPKDPEREKMLQALRALLHALPAEETSVLTRNHRCRTIDELLDLTFDWFATRSPFRV